MENKDKDLPRRKENRVAISGEQPNLSKYRLIKTIGQGSFAKVKLARHMVTNSEVAIKIVNRAQMTADHFKKLKREIDLMKRLVHPNVIQLFEVIEDSKYIYLVMEYACGGEIFDYLIVNGRMKEKEARVKFRQIISAVQYCHQKGVVHRDLKAENLLLEGSDGIKLVDFGFANEFHEGCVLDTFCGSPPYAAPELFLGIKYDGPKVDIWSLGVILYTLVSGSLPFDGSNIRELKDKVLKCRYRIPFFMSNDCESLLKRMIVFNPKNRSSLEELMKHKWLNMGSDNSPLQPYKEDPISNIDVVRLEMMTNMGFAKEEVMKSISEKKFDNAYATYMLLNRYSSSGSCKTTSKTNSTPYDTCELITSNYTSEAADNIQRSNSPEVSPPNNTGIFGKFFNAMSSTATNVIKFINPDNHQSYNHRTSIDSAPSQTESKRIGSKTMSNTKVGNIHNHQRQRQMMNQTSPLKRHVVPNRPALMLTSVAPLPIQVRRKIYPPNKPDKNQKTMSEKREKEQVKLEGILNIGNLSENKKLNPETTVKKIGKSSPTPIIEHIIKEPPKLFVQTPDSPARKNMVKHII